MGDNRILSGNAALVTGGSRGIGRAIALALASAGANVAVSARGTRPGLDEVAEAIRSRGVAGMAVTSNIAMLEESKNLVEQVMARFSRIDILVNNAGTFGYFGRLLNAEEEYWDRTFNVNLKGPFFLSKLVAKVMREQGGGNIINIASTGGIRIGVNYLYATSKAAIMTLTQCMAMDWGQYGIRVNAIAPGLIQTRIAELVYPDRDQLMREIRNNALDRVPTPEDIARTALFLVSHDAAHITGTTIVVDGGQINSLGLDYPVEQYFRPD